MTRLHWTEKTSPTLGAIIAEDPIVVLPVGSTEQHGRHLPVGTDAFATEAVVKRAADRYTGQRPLLLLPTVWTGSSPHHMGLPGTITLRSETFIALLEDVCASLLTHGVRRIVLVNGHGGNTSAMDVALARLGERSLDTERTVGLTYWHLVADRAAELRTSRSGGTGHAGEFETSIVLALQRAEGARYEVALDQAEPVYPELPSRHLSTDLFESAPARRFVPFDRISPSGTFGDPTLASAEQGERILEACSEALAAFLEEFQDW